MVRDGIVIVRTSNPAIQQLHAARSPEYRLFMFHHAGGSATAFQPWRGNFPATWDVVAVNAPGRGRLHDLPPFDRCDQLIDFLLPAVRAQSEEVPYGFFGHSMGGLLAYELSRAIEAQDGSPPTWLGISACRPPTVHPSINEQSGELTDGQLRSWLSSQGDIPPQLLADPDVWKLFAPIFRSDFRLVDSWNPAPGAPALSVPIATFGGTHDPLVASTEHDLWSTHTRHFLGARLYSGAHFYLNAHRQEIARHIATSVIHAARTVHSTI